MREKIPCLFIKREKPNWVENVVLYGFVIIGACYVYAAFLSGACIYAYCDIGSDTVQQYIPFYLNLNQSLQEGSFEFWNLQSGLGTPNLFGTGWLSDPSLLIVLPGMMLFGEAALPILLAVTQVVKIVLCAALAHRYMRFFCKRPIARIFGAFLYAFNGFLVLWGQHYWLGIASVYCMALLVAVELLLQGKTRLRFALLTCIIAVMTIGSLYISCMIIIFGALYTICRIAFLTKGLRAFCCRLLPFIAAVAIGLLISGVVLLPAAHLFLSESARITGTGQPLLYSLANAALSFTSPERFVLNLSRFMSNNLFSVAESTPYLNYYEIVQVGCSFAAPLLIVQYLYNFFRNNSVSPKKKTIVMVSAVLIILFCCNSLLPRLFNVGATTAYRASFCIVCVVVLGMALAVEEAIVPRKISIPALIVSAFAEFFIYFIAFAEATNRARIVCMALFAATIFFVGLLCVIQKKRKGVALILISLTVVCLTVLSDAYITANCRSTLSSEDFPPTGTSEEKISTEIAIDSLLAKDDTLFRIEKTFYDWTWFCDSLVEGYAGVASYNSGLSGGLVSFYETIWPDATLQDTLNIYYQSPRFDLNRPDLLTFLGVKYILSREELNYDWCELYNETGSVKVYLNTEFKGFGQLYSTALTEADYENKYANHDSDVLSHSIIVPNKASLPAENDALLEEIGDISFARESDTRFIGDAQVNAASILAIPIPFNKGWHLQINGEEAEIIEVNYGFIGCALQEGEYEITLSYYPYGLRAGTILSGVGLVVLGVALLRMPRKR